MAEYNEPPIGDPGPRRTVFWPWILAALAVILLGWLLIGTFSGDNRLESPGSEAQPAAERTEPDSIPLPNPTTRPIPD
jgi:hypothetical protein